MIGNTRITQAMKAKMAELENPFYLYDQETILGQVQRLHRDFPDFEFLYSIKTNPFLPVVKTILGEGLGLDAASLREVEIGVENGLPKEKILYSAPGKTERDLRGAMNHAILIADSLHELELINKLAGEKGVKLGVGVRINPDFTMDADHGAAGKFGIDEDQLFGYDFRKLPNIELIGIHVHARSQELHAEVLKKYYANMFALAQKCIDQLGMKMEFINMGGGIGVAYSTENDTDLDTAALGAESAAMLAELRQKLGGVRVIIETGRYAVCTSGYYVTKVVDVKESYGTKFVMVQSTLNGFIRPSLARLIAAYLPEGATAKGNEPLFTKMDAFDFELLTEETATETVNLVGNLCTGTDIMAAGITLPKAKVGDILAITKAGSYAYVLTPVQFSSQPAPGQFLLLADGSMIAE